MAIALFVLVGLHLLLQRTKIGKAMRAVSDNLDLARVAGIDVERVILWTWVLTGVLAALAGALLGLVIGGFTPNTGWFLILPIFASVILGGIGNPYGAILGALVIAVSQELSVIWLGADYKLGVALLIMIIILFWRPQGLFKGMI
jgi:neutral amino acid transport system permease protein